MLTYIELENFRAFSRRARINVRPITVLIGKNSSGKSSVLKFLQMLRQSVGVQDGPFFQTEGRHVNLGAWQDLKNRAAKGRYFKYELGLSARIFGPSQYVRKLVEAQRKGEKPPHQAVIADGPPVEYCISGERFYLGNGERGRFDILAREDGEDVYHRSFGTLAEIGFLRFPIPMDDPDAAYRHIMGDQVFLPPATSLFVGLRHLGPTRNDAQRTVQSESPPDGEVGHRGEHSLAHLVRILGSRDGRDGVSFILRFCESVLRMDKVEVREVIRGLHASFEARNMETQVKHWLADFGFGVSQCLPIFVQGALMSRGDALSIEQPEAQLHPTAQLELASFFAALWKERGVASIIETHSSNVLLRLRKLVREGKVLKPGDVGVAYFHAENGYTEVSNMTVNANGELDGDLPMEFFGADLFEALEFNAIPGASTE